MRAICYSECVQVLTFMIRVSSCKTIGFFRLLLLPPPPIPPPPPPRPHVGILWHLETLMGSCLVDFDIPETLPRCPSILKDPPTGQDLERIPESLPRQRFFGRLFWQEQIADTWRHRVGTITSFRSPPPPPPSPPSVPPPGVCLREQEEKKLWRKRASCCDWRDAAEAAAAAAKWHHPAISSYLSSISSFFSHSFLSLTGYSSVSSPPPFLRPSLFLPFSSFRLFRKFLPAFSFGFSFYSPRLCHSIRKYRDSSGFFKILQDSSGFFRILQDSSGLHGANRVPVIRESQRILKNGDILREGSFRAMSISGGGAAVRMLEADSSLRLPISPLLPTVDFCDYFCWVG